MPEAIDQAEILSPEKQQEVDAYTLRQRKHKERYRPVPLRKRIIRAIEGANRRFWYGLLKRLFNNAPLTQKIPIESLESVLIIPIGDAVGDMVITLPVIDAIKRRNPQTRIGLIISARNESLLRCESQIDEKYTFVDRWDWRHYGELLRARRARYQVVLNVHFTQMSEYGIVANVAGPEAVKVSVTHEQRAELYQTLFTHLTQCRRFRVHLTQLTLKMLDDVVEVRPPILARESQLRLTICPDTLNSIKARTNQMLAELNADWFIYLNPEARNPFREWGVENIAEFAKRFARQYPRGAIVLTSSPVRQAAMKQMIAEHQLERVYFLETSYDLLEIGAVCRYSRLVITPDTSVIHFGTAERKPTLVLWPDRSALPMEWLPYYCPSIHLSPAEYGAPVSTIPVQRVLDAVMALLEGQQTHSSTSYDVNATPIEPFQEYTMDQPLIPLVERYAGIRS